MMYIQAVHSMDKEFEHLGEWLHYWRNQLGYTQLQLGEAVGVSKQHISNLERRQQHGTSGAESNASIELLDKLSRLFNRPVKEARILAGYEKRGHLDTVEEVLDSTMFFSQKGLNEDDKTTLRPYLEMLDREVERLQEMRASQKVSQQPEPKNQLPQTKITPLVLPTGFEIQDRHRSISLKRKEAPKKT